jgi:tetrahydromethanopterin S-methyltransferase subunit D
MLGLILAILAGIVGIFNYATANNLATVILSSIMSLLGMILFYGRRLRPSYKLNGTYIFTFPFALILISLIGNLAILATHLLGL